MRDLDVMEMYAVGGGVNATGTWTDNKGDTYTLGTDVGTGSIKIQIGGSWFDFGDWVNNLGEGISNAAVNLVDNVGNEISNAWNTILDDGRAIIDWIERALGFGSSH